MTTIRRPMFLFIMQLMLIALSPSTRTISWTMAFLLMGQQQRRHDGRCHVVATRQLCKIMALPPRLKGESSEAYFQRLTAAAADPHAFERLALQKQQENSISNSDSDSAVTSVENPTNDDDDDDTMPNNNTRRKYVRVEEWEEEQQRKRRSGQLSWEERVAFDGQRHGNRFNQNEILRHHLNAF